MLSCPNKKDPNWIKLVESVGESTAYNIYNANNGIIPTLGIALNGNSSKLYQDLVNKNPNEASIIWYKTYTKEGLLSNYLRDENNEPLIESLLQYTQDTKYSQYISSVSPEINDAITSADKFIKKVHINFATRAQSHPQSKAADVVDTFNENNLNKDIAELELANLANGLQAVLEYTSYTLSHAPTPYNKGGLLEQLSFYSKQDLEELFENENARVNFWKFMSYAKNFIDGYITVELLQSSSDIENLTEDETVVNNLIKEIQNLSPIINDLSAKFDTLHQRANTTTLNKYTSNPEIILGLRELFEITDDESGIQLLLDAMGDTHVPFVANLIKRYTFQMTNAQLEYIKDQKKLADVLRRTFGITDLSQLTEQHFDKYLEKDINGTPTGKLVQRYDWDRFYADKKKYFDEIAHLKVSNYEQYINKSKWWYKNKEKNTIPTEEVKKVIKEKEETLPRREYYAWLKRNVRYNKDANTITVKMGDHIFKEPSDDYINPKYKLLEKDELFIYLNETLVKMAKHLGKEQLFQEGYLPMMSKDEKENASWFEKGIAWIESQGAKEKSKTFVGENNQIVRILTIPMVQRLSLEEPIKYRERRYNEDFEDWQASILDDIAIAGKGEFKSFDEVKKHNAAIKERNEKYAAGKQNYNLYEVFNTFIKEATIYKYKSAMKNEFDLGIHQIRKMQFNKRTGADKLINNWAGTKITGDKVTQTISGEGSNLENHFDQWLDAIFYGNFTIDEGTKTKIVNILLKYVSAKNMWLNLTAGIGNIAYNRAQLRAEAIGGYYYDSTDLMIADKQYTAALFDMLSNNGKEERNTLTGAVIKLFDVLQNTNEKDYAAGLLHKKLLSTDTLYMFNNAGEHYSQNIPLIAMLNSHRVINGEFVGFNQFRYTNYKKALYNILNQDQIVKLEQYWQARMKNEEFKDGKKDYLRDFILTLSPQQQELFIKEKKQLDKSAKEQFDKYPKGIDAFDLENGVAVFRDSIEIEGQILNTKLKPNAFADFKNKVANLNRKNNGIYNVEDSSTFARTALGKMALQFRKYMRPSWNKRFGTKFGKSFWNEQRSEWDKGSYISMLQFLGTGYKDLSFNIREGADVITFLGNLTKGMTKLATNFKVYYNTLDDFEKANVKRAATEMALLTFTIFLGYALSQMKGDDDDEPLAYDLAVYQTDRLMSELMFYTPFGLINEGQKLLKTPFAAQSALIDIARFTGSLIAYPFQEEQERIYQTGMYRDEVRLKINTLKLIPVVNKYQQLNRIDKFNKYYILFRG